MGCSPCSSKAIWLPGPQLALTSLGTCAGGGGIITEPPSFLSIVCWTKTVQVAGNNHLLPIPEIPGHPVDPVQVYNQLISASSTTSPDQHLFTITKVCRRVWVTVDMLSEVLRGMLSPLGMNYTLISLCSLMRGGTMVAYYNGINKLDKKCYNLWKSDTFWAYVTAPCVS